MCRLTAPSNELWHHRSLQSVLRSNGGDEPMLAYVRYILTIKLVGNNLIRKQKNLPPSQHQPPRVLKTELLRL